MSWIVDSIKVLNLLDLALDPAPDWMRSQLQRSLVAAALDEGGRNSENEKGRENPAFFVALQGDDQTTDTLTALRPFGVSSTS